MPEDTDVSDGSSDIVPRDGSDRARRARGLPRRGPGVARGATCPTQPLPSLDTEAGFAAHREWERRDVRRAAGGRHLARGVRRARRRTARVAGLRRGVLGCRRAGAGQPERHLPARADDLRVRHRGAEGTLPYPDGEGRGGLGAGLVGAGRRQRPRVAAVQGREGRRRLAAVRSEDLVDARRPSPTGCSGCSVPTRPRSATAA